MPAFGIRNMIFTRIAGIWTENGSKLQKQLIKTDAADGRGQRMWLISVHSLRDAASAEKYIQRARFLSEVRTLKTKSAAYIIFVEDQIKMKWRNLRDQFSRELKKNPVAEDGSPIVEKYYGKWAYYDSLTFLKDNVCLNPSDETKYDDIQIDDFSKNENEVSVVIKRDPDIFEHGEIEGDAFLDPLDGQEDTSDSNLMAQESNDILRKRLCQRKAKSSYVQRHMNLQNEMMQTSRLSSREVDDDLHFALSLVPYLRSLDPLRKLVIRSEMQNLLLGELLGESSAAPHTPKKKLTD